jgi:hypothetical protein
MLSLILTLCLCQDQIDKWITDLDSDSIELRAEAEKQLRALDGSMLERVRRAPEMSLEAKIRLAEIIIVLDHKAKISERIKSYPTVTVEYKDAPFHVVINDLKKHGVEFTGTLEDGLKLTASFKNAPMMQVIDTLARVAKVQWMWHHTGVIWMGNPALNGGPAIYDHGFRVRIHKVGADRLDNFDSKSQVTRLWLDVLAEPNIEYVAPTIIWNVNPASIWLGSPDHTGPVMSTCTRNWGLDSAQPIALYADKITAKATISGKVRVLFQTGPSRLTITKEPVKYKAYELTLDESHHITITGPAKKWLAEHVVNLVVIDSAGVEYGASIHAISYIDESTCKIYLGCQLSDIKEVHLTFYDEVLEHYIPFEFKNVELP